MTIMAAFPGMHICPQCNGQLVYPLNHQPQGPAAYKVHLRCPDCEWRQIGVYHKDFCLELEQRLEKAEEQMIAARRQFDVDAMTDYVNRFAAALTLDGIVPFDFGAA